MKVTGLFDVAPVASGFQADIANFSDAEFDADAVIDVAGYR